METFFEIDIREPFSVSMISGEIEPGSSIDLNFVFSPKVTYIILDY